MQRPDISRIRDLDFIHAHSIRHRDEIERSNRCGCFYCERIFSPGEIKDWVDESEQFPEGCTALCPHCGIDSVLPSVTITLNAELLAEMRFVYFDL